MESIKAARVTIEFDTNKRAENEVIIIEEDESPEEFKKRVISQLNEVFKLDN